MSFEKPPTPSSEEVAEIEKERTLSNADLLREGASFVSDEGQEPRLELEQDQIDTIEKERSKEENERVSEEVLDIITILHQARHLGVIKEALRNKEGKVVFAEDGEAEIFEQIYNDEEFRNNLKTIINIAYGVTLKK